MGKLKIDDETLIEAKRFDRAQMMYQYDKNEAMKALSKEFGSTYKYYYTFKLRKQ